jgi:predicted nucleic acid-binding protein
LNLYLDTNALLKRYINEPGSSDIRALIRQATLFATARITRVEIAAALAKVVRVGALRRRRALYSLDAFQRDWVHIFRIDVSETLVGNAASLAWMHRLRGYDAIHLAAALSWQEELGEPVSLVTYDRQLWAVAKLVDLSVFPEHLS